MHFIKQIAINGKFICERELISNDNLSEVTRNYGTQNVPDQTMPTGLANK